MCDFCEKYEKAEPEVKGEGINTAMNNLNLLFGYHETGDGIHLDDDNYLMFDNSSGEYAELGVKIKYCPMCGREL